MEAGSNILTGNINTSASPNIFVDHPNPPSTGCETIDPALLEQDCPTTSTAFKALDGIDIPPGDLIALLRLPLPSEDIGYNLPLPSTTRDIGGNLPLSTSTTGPSASLNVLGVWLLEEGMNDQSEQAIKELSGPDGVYGSVFSTLSWRAFANSDSHTMLQYQSCYSR